jgi:hypothetical protein
MSFCLSNVSEFWFIPSQIIPHHHLYGILILKSTYFSQGGKRENLQIIGDKPIYIYIIYKGINQNSSSLQEINTYYFYYKLKQLTYTR